MRKTLAAVVVATIALMAGCIPAYEGNPSGEKVGVLGNSITSLSKEEIEAALRPTHQVSVSGNNGKKLIEMIDVGQEYADSDPDVMVIQFGTNDVGDPAWDPLWEFLAVADMAARFTEQRCLYWVNVEEHVNDGWWNERATAFNGYVEFWRSEYPNLQPINWNGVVEYFGRDVMLCPDQVHPSEFGQFVLAAMIQDAATHCPGYVT